MYVATIIINFVLIGLKIYEYVQLNSKKCFSNKTTQYAYLTFIMISGIQTIFLCYFFYKKIYDNNESITYILFIIVFSSILIQIHIYFFNFANEPICYPNQKMINNGIIIMNGLLVLLMISQMIYMFK